MPIGYFISLMHYNFEKIQGVFTQLGISKIQTFLYLKLLEVGPNSLTDLSREIKIPRTTVHENVAKLLELGLITQTFHETRRVLVAEKPNKIKLLLTKEKLDLENKQREIKNVEDNLSGIIKSIYDSVPQVEETTKVAIKYYQGKKQVKQIYTEVLKAKEMRAFFTSKISKVFPNNPQLFIEEHNRRKDMIIWEICDRSPSNDEYIAKMNKKRFFYKYIKKGFEMLDLIDYLIFDEKVAIVDLKNDDPNQVFGILIESFNFYKTSKIIHQLVWNLL